MNRLAHFFDQWCIPNARLASIISLLVLSTISYSSLWALDCNPVIMALNSQAEVDSFQNTYGPCDRVLTLYVEGADINNLDGLSALIETGSSLLPDVAGEVIINDNLPACNSIVEILAQVDVSRLNAGLNDAWYNPDTDGQGFFINVFPALGAVSLAWFTYDTELPPGDAQAKLGDPGHRWFTAVGPIVDNQVLMEIEMTSGGLFDTATEIQRTDPPGSDGTIILNFTSCNTGTVEYDIPSINGHGIVPIQRVANDNIGLCEVLSAD